MTLNKNEREQHRTLSNNIITFRFKLVENTYKLSKNKYKLKGFNLKTFMYEKNKILNL